MEKMEKKIHRENKKIDCSALKMIIFVVFYLRSDPNVRAG